MHTAGTNPCAINNGGCAHLCLLSFSNSRNHTCACHNGTQLHQNGRNCIGKTALVHVNPVHDVSFVYAGGGITVAPVTQGIANNAILHMDP